MSELNSFSSLALPEPILRAISEMGFDKATPIQAQSIPALLDSQDVLGEAQTGTGKTAAFGLPGLSHIDPKLNATQMIVVAPTRELAIQVAEQLEAMSKYIRGLRVATVYGGAAYGPQIKNLKQGAHVVVGTPGRMMDHLRKGTMGTENIRVAVLDEADEMLNMGFLDDIEWIMEQVPEGAQRCLFSATMPPQIRKIANRFLREPTHVKIASTKENKANIAQKAWKVQGLTKNDGLERILETSGYELALIFVRTRQDTLTLASFLRDRGFAAAGLNGDMNQEQREATVSELKAGKVRILVATDVVARGLDVQGVTHVINYDLPQDAESYVHRIGRTGRAGRSGESISFVRPREMYMLKRYEKATNGRIELVDIPRGRELTKHRLTQCENVLKSVIESQDMDTMTSLLNQLAESSEQSIETLAAALLFEFQKQRPLIVKDKPVPKHDRNERSPRDRNDRGARFDKRGGNRDARNEGRGKDGKRKPRRDANIEFDTYRLAVGKNHGARPGDVVGAIANEANMDSRYIGEIRLFDQHTTVQLPKGMPSDVLNKLKRARVRQQPISISLV
ncbi:MULTISPECIES: DEAD/DEAH box helicase [Gammaproteobacteria]|uniref:DEAD/DEAH box helicase n=1 Tax=Gammaproteobacteria TaxID=1236 RepID=UPI000DD011ED|nr:MULTISPECIES: DEAD/DEAH box helicase [Gammaproteobacteria]RTE85970.1 DEAD/DEAH box helicase [Aliidiomarina sp. B3213]TCZ90031.1 DEAD/DEAH box helicase [Lysobacter sp. N42]